MVLNALNVVQKKGVRKQVIIIIAMVITMWRVQQLIRFFHKVKFGLQKAFLIVFKMTTSSKSLSSIQVAKRYGISQATAWFFMQKVKVAMKSSQKYPLIRSCSSR